MIKCPFSSSNTPSEKLPSTREQILLAAKIALARDGYEKITTRSIAKEAQVNIATLHYYFGTKEALLDETISYSKERFREVLEKAIEDAPNAQIAQKLLIEFILKLVMELPDMLRYDLVVRGFREKKDNQCAQEMYASYRFLEATILQRHLREGGTLRAGATVESVACYVVAAIDGTILQHLIFNQVEATEGILQIILDHTLSLMEIESKATQ
jgi:AcrR family transcriptional regulator